MSDDLDKICAPLAAELLPGWKVSWQWCKPEQIGGALACVVPDPKRSQAAIYVAPHPKGESVRESVIHEIVHAVISPLVQLIEPSEAQIMIEEPIVERLAMFIAKHPGLARNVSRALSPRLRQRIARRRAGGTMGLSQEQKAEMIKVIEGGDGAAALEMIKAILAGDDGGEGGGDAPIESASREEEGGGDDGAAPMREETDAEPKARGRSAAQRHGARGAARPASDKDETRRREAIDSAVKDSIELKILKLREKGTVLTADQERELLRCRSVADAERLIKFAGASANGGAGGQGNGSQRARSGNLPANAPASAGGQGGAPEDPEALRMEGLSESFVKSYLKQHEADPALAAARLAGARARNKTASHPWKRNSASGAGGK